METVNQTAEEKAKFGPRTYANPSGDWKKTEKAIAEIKKWAEVMDGLVNDIATAQSKIDELMLEAYRNAPETDALYNDSPVSPLRTVYYLRSHLFKAGSKIVRPSLQDVTKIKKFSEAISDGLLWLVKFKTEKSS